MTETTRNNTPLRKTHPPLNCTIWRGVLVWDRPASKSAKRDVEVHREDDLFAGPVKPGICHPASMPCQMPLMIIDPPRSLDHSTICVSAFDPVLPRAMCLHQAIALVIADLTQARSPPPALTTGSRPIGPEGRMAPEDAEADDGSLVHALWV